MLIVYLKKEIIETLLVIFCHQYYIYKARNIVVNQLVLQRGVFSFNETSII